MSFLELIREREKTHGSWYRTARIAQALKATLNWGENEGRRLSDGQREALDSIATKIARILSGDADEPDHWRDIAGYAELGAQSKRGDDDE